MAVVEYKRISDGATISGRVGESLRITEAWDVRVDSPLTSKLEIFKAVPCGYFTPHWDFPDCKAMEVNVASRARDGMIWTVTITFYVPPVEKVVDAEGVPEDYWEASGGTTTVPLFVDVNGAMITNSAGDPLEGLEREREELSWTLTKHYTDDSWIEDRLAYAGHVNSTSWAGGDEKTWKCYFKSATKREIQDLSLNKEGSDASSGEPNPLFDENDGQVRQYVETKWEFRYEPQTWMTMPWDVGFMELNGSGEKIAVLGTDGRPVKQPVALNPDGTAKDPGEPPDVIRDGDGADIYPDANFFSWVGDPYMIEAS